MPEKTPQPPLNLDADPINADWTKQTWDLPFDNAKDLRAHLKASGQTVEQFKRLPVYQMNKDKPGMEWLKDLDASKPVPHKVQGPKGKRKG